jgi:hypothetical protein
MEARSIVNLRDVIIGAILMTIGAIFWGRMNRRKETSRWKYFGAYLLMMCGAAFATWEHFWTQAFNR